MKWNSDTVLQGLSIVGGLALFGYLVGYKGETVEGAGAAVVTVLALLSKSLRPSKDVDQ